MRGASTGSAAPPGAGRRGGRTREGRRLSDPALLSIPNLLRWVYLARAALVTGILLSALLEWADAHVHVTFIATVMFAVALPVTGASLWYTHLQARDPGWTFRYAQVVFDVLLVTTIVAITGGGESPFSWIYIPVISVGALLLPLRGGVLIGILISVLYFATVVWLDLDTPMTGAVGLQMGLFTAVAVVTGLLGDRMRRAGMALGEVQSELHRLRLDTGEILDTISTGVLTVDGEGRMVYINPAGETLLGLRGDAWLGAPIVDVVEDVSPELGSLLRRSLEERRALSRYKALARRNGEEVLLGVSTTAREGEAGLSATAIFQDITVQERLAELNRRAERLEAVAELSASMAHEIKNPLSSIRSAVEQFTKPSLDGKDRELLVRMVVKESDRLSRLLSDFIDFSRLQLGEVEEVDLSVVVRDCLAVVRQHPDLSDGVQMRHEGLDDPVWVPGDQDLLHRAIFNLTLNAAQFAGAGGEVVVSVKDYREEGRPPGVGVPAPVRLAVRDTGPGVPREAVARIFDPFYTTRKGGSGLGLAVVHRAVEVHQGAVFVESEEGEGAEFVIYLPGHGAAQAPAGTGVGSSEARTET